MANIKEMYDKRISILTTAEDRRKLAALKIVLGQSKMEIVRELIRREYEARVKGQSNGQASR